MTNDEREEQRKFNRNRNIYLHRLRVKKNNRLRSAIAKASRKRNR